MHDPMDDDRQLEAYLMTFRPLPPDPLPKTARSWTVFALSGAAALAAGVAALVLLVPQGRNAKVDRPDTTPMTLGSANALLTHAESWNDVIDDARFAFHPAFQRKPPERKSALEILSQENF